MQLIYEATKTELNRDMTAFNKVIEKVNEISEQEKKGFSHLVIDGVDVYEDHEQYINERLNEIMQIEIIALTISEIVWETLGSVADYLERAIPAVRELATGGLVEFTPGTWLGMEQLTDGMNWMLQFVEFTRQANKQPANWAKVDAAFGVCEEQFTAILTAAENEDTVKIAELLSTGIIPAYERLLKNVEIALEDEQYIQ